MTQERAPATPIIDQVLDAARRFGPIWAQSPRKTGYAGSRGSRDASRDEATIRRWWAEHPEAVPALMTGEVSGVVALDVDRKPGRDGFDSLEAVGVAFHPETVTSHTPSGGCHLLFRWPGYFVRSNGDVLGPGLEVKGDGSWITLPPGPGRFWDPHLNLDTVPLAPMPEWMVPPEPEPKRPAQAWPKLPRASAGLTRYGEAAFDAAVMAIMRAPAGSQEQTLNAEAFALGQLVAGSELSERLALDGLLAAARRMPSYERGNPWNPDKLAIKIRRALAQGMAHPRGAP